MISFGLTFFRFLQGIVRSWSNPYFRATLVLALLILLSGTLFYRSVEGWSWIDSVYFSVMTAATISPADLSPSQPASRLFTVFYAITSIGVFVTLATLMARALIGSHDEANDKAQAGSARDT